MWLLNQMTLLGAALSVLLLLATPMRCQAQTVLTTQSSPIFAAGNITCTWTLSTWSSWSPTCGYAFHFRWFVCPGGGCCGARPDPFIFPEQARIAECPTTTTTTTTPTTPPATTAATGKAAGDSVATTTIRTTTTTTATTSTADPCILGTIGVTQLYYGNQLAVLTSYEQGQLVLSLREKIMSLAKLRACQILGLEVHANYIQVSTNSRAAKEALETVTAANDGICVNVSSNMQCGKLTADSTSTVSNSAAPNTNGNDSSSSSSSFGSALSGYQIAVIVVGAALLVLLVALFVVRQRKQRAQEHLSQHYYEDVLDLSISSSTMNSLQQRSSFGKGPAPMPPPLPSSRRGGFCLCCVCVCVCV